MDYLELDNLIITIDNAVSIGENELDDVYCPFDICAKYTARTAVLDGLSSGAIPKVITFSNGAGDKAFNKILSGIEEFLRELEVSCQIIGSSESNFKIKQSSMAVTVIGQKKDMFKKEDGSKKKYAVLGLQLVGPEVLNNPDKIISVTELLNIIPKVYRFIPIGSKGINGYIKQMFSDGYEVSLDTKKSGGPSTSVIIEYSESDEDVIKSNISCPFNKIEVVR